MSDDVHQVDKETAKSLFEHLNRNNDWNQHNENNTFKRAYSSLSFALRGREIKAALVSVEDDKHRFVVLTEQVLLLTEYERASGASTSPVNVRPLRGLKGLYAATNGTLFSQEFLPDWPRGAAIEAVFDDLRVDFTPYLKNLNSNYAAEYATVLYETLLVHLEG